LPRVNIWNSLLNHDVNTVILFKARLDGFWMNKDVKRRSNRYEEICET